MTGSRERSRDPAIVFSRTRPGRSRMIVLTFPPVGQLSSFPPHGVNIFPTTRPHVSGKCPAPRSGVRNVHHTSVLFPGRVRPGHRLIGRPHPRGGTPTRARGDRQLSRIRDGNSRSPLPSRSPCAEHIATGAVERAGSSPRRHWQMTWPHPHRRAIASHRARPR